MIGKDVQSLRYLLLLLKWKKSKIGYPGSVETYKIILMRKFLEKTHPIFCRNTDKF